MNNLREYPVVYQFPIIRIGPLAAPKKETIAAPFPARPVPPIFFPGLHAFFETFPLLLYPALSENDPQTHGFVPQRKLSVPNLDDLESFRPGSSPTSRAPDNAPEPVTRSIQLGGKIAESFPNRGAPKTLILAKKTEDWYLERRKD